MESSCSFSIVELDIHIVISDSAYRMNERNADLPQIPVHPIGYGDAYMLLK